MSLEAKKENKRSGVLICGAYGMENGGDEAILEAIVGEMRAIDPDMPVTVLSRTPELTAKKYGVASLHMFDLPGFLRVMKGCTLYINGGGSLIQDVTSSRSLWYYLYTLRAAKRRGCRVLMYGCGIGPVSRPRNRSVAKRYIDRYVDEITLREENSLDELRSFGVTRPRITVASDPALTLLPAPEGEVDEKMRSLGLDPNGAYVCFCLRSWEGFGERADCFARAADYVFERYGMEPVFLSVNTRSDGAAAQSAARTISAPCRIIAEPMPTDMTIGIISRMRAVVSIRLHGLIFAASQAVPSVGIAYDPKVSAFLDYIGQENYATLDALTAQGLCDMLDRALDTDREALSQRVGQLRSIESRNSAAVRRLLGMEEE